MLYNHLEGLDIKPSCIGFGGWPLGGHGWGKGSSPEIIKAVHKAIDCGVNFFDTAPIYGLGHSEELLGKALGSKRKDVIIATKVGLTWKKGKTFQKFTDSSPANISREIGESLKRLNTDYIDLYQIHWPDPNTPIVDTLSAMEKLKNSGKIRCIGCCNFPLQLLMEWLKYGEINTIQIRYNLIDSEAETDLLAFCKENGIGVLTHSSIAQGLLSGKYDTNSKFGANDHRSRDEHFQGEAFLKNLEVLKRVKFIAQKLSKTPTQIALRWVLQNPCVTTAFVGIKSVVQIEENVVASDFALSKDDMDFLNEEVCGNVA
jgi:aryl-alcohol dehydrogenase-like predicted oxidoreductase